MSSLSFVQDKNNFFQNQHSIAEINQLEKKDYLFLTDNRSSIESELNEISAVLDKNGDNREQYWLYSYYLCLQLKTYYDAYSTSKAEEYAKLSVKIANHINGVAEEAPDAALSIFDMLRRDLYELKAIFLSTTKLATWDGRLNMQRISTRFSMITLQQTLVLARQYQALDMFERMLGVTVNIAILDVPLGVYNALSVALFVVRFSINFGLLIKHTFFPVGDEEQLTMARRCYEELKANHITMVNDVVWATANGLSNYANYFHIAASTANVLVGSFLLFDTAWFCYALYLLEMGYQNRKAQYQDYASNFEVNPQMQQMLAEQLMQLEINTEKKRATLQFCIAASLLLVAGFGGAVAVSSPILVPFCFLVCNIAIAMFLTSGKYGVYKEKLMIDSLSAADDAQVDVNDAWNDLSMTMLKNTIMPFILLSAYTLNVPLAIGLTLSYMAYENGGMAYLPDVADVRTFFNM